MQQIVATIYFMVLNGLIKKTCYTLQKQILALKIARHVTLIVVKNRAMYHHLKHN